MNSKSKCHPLHVSKSLVCLVAIILVFVSATTKIENLSERRLLSSYNRVALILSELTIVPAPVLFSITLAETGRKRDNNFQPWPWTVNMEVKGDWFDSSDATLAYVNKEYRRGARSFDVGCFQLNYRWHGQGISSIEEMLDPQKNALYAAKFFEELYLEKGYWGNAAAAYHSRTLKYADKYKAISQKFYSKFLTQAPLRIKKSRVNHGHNTDANGSSERTIYNNFLPLLKLESLVKTGLGSLYSTDAGIDIFWNDG